VVDGTVPVLTTVGAGRAAQAVPATKSSARAVVVNSSSVFLMIFLSPSPQQELFFASQGE
jgi:hypothetical protein